MADWTCDLDSTVPDWVIEHPATLAVFQTYGIDCSCGGKSLGYVCQQQGVSPQLILQKLHDCLDEDARDEQRTPPRD